MLYPWHLIFLAILFLIAGIFHFIKPRAFMRIMPRYLPAHKQLVFLSGMAEILVAIGLIYAPTRPFAAWFCIAMLISFLPVHIYMITHEKASLNLPKWLLYSRLVLQGILIYWVYQYTLTVV